METDEEADLRIFNGVFEWKANVSHETFVFGSDVMHVAVSVDYSQGGMQKYLTCTVVSNLPLVTTM